MNDIYISVSELETVASALESITTELENAQSNSEALEQAIGAPYGHTTLRTRAADFEERWDLKRKQLAEDLTKVTEHVKAVVEEVQKWDEETAIKLTPKK